MFAFAALAIALSTHGAPPGLIVCQQAMPPPHNGGYLPMTCAWSGNPIAANIGDGSVAIWDTTWANRAVGGPAKACNPIPSSPMGPDGKLAVMCFSTPERADAATMAEVLRKNGQKAAVWQAPLVAAGVRIVQQADAAASPATFFPVYNADGGGYAGTDQYIVPAAPRVYARTPAVIGIDYEVNDGRSVGQAQAFLDWFGDAARQLGAKSYFYTNPWNAPVMHFGGIVPADLTEIATHYDYLSLLTTPLTPTTGGQAADYAAGAAILRGAGVDPSRWIATFYWDSPVAEACQFHALQARDRFAGYNIHPHTIAPGPAPYEVEAALLFGQGC